MVYIEKYEIYELLQVAGVKHRVMSMNNNVFKINVSDGEQYRRLINVLHENKKEHFTYEDKQN